MPECGYRASSVFHLCCLRTLDSRLRGNDGVERANEEEGAGTTPSSVMPECGYRASSVFHLCCLRTLDSRLRGNDELERANEDEGAEMTA
ncbi:hypothetical protein [Lacimicrobium sp. SS2-24]|uniref:hypothetical protein n=1 Tax=Lacimicrobium sp. SS2-24 TaxID=2005569 RepID=UPI001438F441|nr:hypothetical protein [Lacimicrobium sp. SS2-24]